MSGPQFVGELNQAFMAPTEDFMGADSVGDGAPPGRKLLATLLGKAAAPLRHLQASIPSALKPRVEDGFKEPPLVVSAVEGSVASFPLSLAHVTEYVPLRR